MSSVSPHLPQFQQSAGGHPLCSLWVNWHNLGLRRGKKLHAAQL
jgi:hypothetical protein